MQYIILRKIAIYMKNAKDSKVNRMKVEEKSPSKGFILSSERAGAKGLTKDDAEERKT